VIERAVYRVRQFAAALNPAVSESERKAARGALGDNLYPLFESMHPADQRHCIDVFERLLQDGIQDDAALKAALIHDCGKGALSGARITLADRVAHVLVSPLPALAQPLAARRPGMRVLRDHAQLTIDLARQHGAPDRVVELLEEMEGFREPGDPGRALKRADDLH
jgi:hypothetical protein